MIDRPIDLDAIKREHEADASCFPELDRAEYMALSASIHRRRGQLIAEVERLRGIKPELPPRPPAGEGLPRYGLRWNGPKEPLAVPMDGGYWTPWHLAERLRARVAELERDAARYRWLRDAPATKESEPIRSWLWNRPYGANMANLDDAIDAAMSEGER